MIQINQFEYPSWRLTLERPLVGFNVIQKRITSNESKPKVMSILISLLTSALETDTARAEVIMRFILAELQQGEQMPQSR